NNVGLIDVSTLGGLDVRGPDAAEFLNRMYTFTYTKLAVGRSRYVLMTDQAGAVIDDGVACRFHDEHFYVTATTGGVDGVYRTMLFWNAQWRLNVDVANVTAAYAGVNIAGPRSREVLQTLCTDTDLSPTAFPYLGVRQATVAGVPCRLLRVGFVGELGYEIHMPAHYGEHVWDALMEAGKPLGIRPFGVEAQRVLRLEKGHIIIGQDTDGLTHPYEADMAWAVAKSKPFFVGQRSARSSAWPMSRPTRPSPARASTSRSRAGASSRQRSSRFPSMIPKTSGRRCDTACLLKPPSRPPPSRAAAASTVSCSRPARASRRSTTPPSPSTSASRSRPKRRKPAAWASPTSRCFRAPASRARARWNG